MTAWCNNRKWTEAVLPRAERCSVVPEKAENRPGIRKLGAAELFQNENQKRPKC